MAESKRLTEKECWELLRKHGTPGHVIRHCCAVSDAASRIAAQMIEHGVPLDLELIRMAGLIHDVARTSDHHEQVGADILEDLGYYDEAKIVRAHMRHRFNDISEVTETDLMCIGDRLVKEDRYVGLDERVEYLINKPGKSPERTARLLIGKEQTRKFMQGIEAIIGRTIDSLFVPSLDELLKQVEKPARYIGGETNMVVKDPNDVDVRFAFAFPDLYEIGMSYMGMQILYGITNKSSEIYCERVFSPAPDMEELMRKYHVPLFTLETKTPVNKMDAVGFTLQYEMSFPTILNILELSDIPLLTKDRGENDPIVMAGGPCAFNPEPLADFFDFFMVGDGEFLLPQVLKEYGKAKKNGLSRRDYLKQISRLTGVYVPQFYEPVYYDSGIVKEYKKTWNGAPDKVKKALIPDLKDAWFPTENIIPLIDAVHDRSVVETFRGCTRGCRFCQAGMIYRPVRERSIDTIMEIARKQLGNTGHDELSILSLSTSDYSDFETLATGLMNYCREHNVSLSLPSLRLDSFSFNVLEEIQKYKKSGLTFAPEAGTQHLRDVINKGITEDDIFSAVRQAIELGWRHIKFYFMDGLPWETDEDLDGIPAIASEVTRIFKESGAKGRFNVTCSVSNFVPKSHTPFQWMGQVSTEEFRRKHIYLSGKMKMKGVRLTYHDDAVSTCEAIFARGDRRCGQLLMTLHEAGCKLDAWGEHFKRDAWAEALNHWEIDYRFYTERERPYDEVLPWDVIDSGVSKEFLIRESEKARRAEVTPDCRKKCAGCGLNKRTVCAHGGKYE